jgi:thiamine transport system substrate-binding protein
VRAVRTATALALLVLPAAVVACGDDGDDERVVRLLTHDSFVVSPDVLDEFTERTGYEVEVVMAGDAGSMVNQAILTKDRPLGDALFGIDTTFLALGLDEGLFAPYRSPELAAVPDGLEVDPEHRVTPIDLGDVCVNYDRSYFEEPGAPPVPTTLADLTDPAYEDLLAVEDPATSSPGLAFVAATVDVFGEAGWEEWWTDLRANGVTVANDWTEAYYGEFSGGASSEGDKPLVVSYASSPAAEVDPTGESSLTGVVEGTCTRQVEYAGVLAGATNARGARALIDFLLSERVQEDIPSNMFVYPVRDGAGLPDAFERFATLPADPIEIDPLAFGVVRDDLIDRWTDLVLR